MLFFIKKGVSNTIANAIVVGATLSCLAVPVLAQSWQSPEDLSYLNSLETMAVSMELGSLAADSAITLFASPTRSDLIVAATDGDIAACYELAALTEAAPLVGEAMNDSWQMSDDYLAAVASCHVESLGGAVE